MHESLGYGIRYQYGMFRQELHEGQGLALVHFSAQRKHSLWDALGA